MVTFFHRNPKDASWKYIEAIGDAITEPYGMMSVYWMQEVYRRARNIKRLRRHSKW